MVFMHMTLGKNTSKMRWSLLILQDQISLNPSSAAKTSSQWPKIKHTHTHTTSHGSRQQTKTSKLQNREAFCDFCILLLRFILIPEHFQEIWVFFCPKPIQHWIRFRVSNSLGVNRNLGVNGWMVGLMVGLSCLKELQLVGFICFFCSNFRSPVKKHIHLGGEIFDSGNLVWSPTIHTMTRHLKQIQLHTCVLR